LREYKFHNFWTYVQKLWRFEKFGRNLGRAGMYWSQPTRVDHMCKKMWIGGRRKNLQGGSLGHPCATGGRPLVTDWPWSFDSWSLASRQPRPTGKQQSPLAAIYNLIDCGLLPPPSISPIFLSFIFIFLVI
jgi:hypothetical protein